MFIPEYEPIDFNRTKHAKIIKMHSISETFMQLMDEFAKGFLTIHTASIRMRLQWEYTSADLCEGKISFRSIVSFFLFYSICKNHSYGAFRDGNLTC